MCSLPLGIYGNRPPPRQDTGFSDMIFYPLRRFAPSPLAIRGGFQEKMAYKQPLPKQVAGENG